VSNWFLGLPLEALHGLELPAPPLGVRRLDPADLHVTLSFLGAVGEDRARSAAAVFAQQLQARPRRALDVSFERVLPLGPPARFSVLAATLGEGRDECAAWLEELRDAPCDALGIPRDLRPPLPHVTLARVDRHARPRERERALEWAAGLDLSRARARITVAALFTRAPLGDKSRSSGGQRYARVLEWNLR
jgi:2'-5' RNA ligase